MKKSNHHARFSSYFITKTNQTSPTLLYKQNGRHMHMSTGTMEQTVFRIFVYLFLVLRIFVAKTLWSSYLIVEMMWNALIFRWFFLEKDASVGIVQDDRCHVLHWSSNLVLMSLSNLHCIISWLKDLRLLPNLLFRGKMEFSANPRCAPLVVAQFSMSLVELPFKYRSNPWGKLYRCWFYNTVFSLRREFAQGTKPDELVILNCDVGS